MVSDYVRHTFRKFFFFFFFSKYIMVEQQASFKMLLHISELNAHIWTYFPAPEAFLFCFVCIAFIKTEMGIQRRVSEMYSILFRLG